VELSDSTLIGCPSEGKAGLRRLAARILGGSQSRFPPDKLAALLLPMVSRVVRTERGPAALVCWLRQWTDTPPAGHQTERVARTLTEDLVRFLSDPPGSPADTLDDS
jgi:hypothetical protein